MDHRSRVSVRQCYYSVPARYVGPEIDRPVDRHHGRGSSTGRAWSRLTERAIGRYVDVLCLDHYLEVLARKPGAFPGATALAQAKASGAFTPAHQRYWDAARRARGDGPGTRALVEVLLAHRTLPAHLLTEAMERAVAADMLNPDVVLIDARRAAARHVAPVVPIGAARPLRPAHAVAARLRRLADRRSRREREPVMTTDTAATASINVSARGNRPYRPSAPKPTGSPRSPPGNGSPTSDSSPKCWPRRSTTAPNDAAPAASPKPSSPAQTTGRLQPRRRPHHHPRHPRAPRVRGLPRRR